MDNTQDPPSSIPKSKTVNSNVMYWTSEHDVLLCREVASENRFKTRKGSSQRSEIWDRIANTLNTCPKPFFAVDKRSITVSFPGALPYLILYLISNIRLAEERSSGIAPPEPTELENLVEEITALEETADAETKEDDESVKEKAEKEKAKATDMRRKALEKVSETMKRHSSENDQEKVKKIERRSGSETMLFLSKKAEKDQELKLEELQLKNEQHDLDAKRLQASIDQQRQFQQQQSEMRRLMQQLMLRQQQDQTKALMSLLDKLVNK
ncbi:hypothetical protein AWC38_SpisGene10643 [Stylophora pistillata]|uniref:Uncharacterized protein n=1 Tax=Stylophora pistillata TaxID=50429 RepID=A0A2B4S888_STYPI|nr:hypothetical protein AWC38_SpisGene10643 [Stylophora pistillata]